MRNQACVRGEKTIVTLGVVAFPDPGGALRARILHAVARGIEWPPSEGEPRWACKPGAVNWATARQHVGGRVHSETFRRAVDGLLAEGRLIEVWLDWPQGRNAPHLLLLPGHSAVLKGPVAKARGRADVLAREPWHATLEHPAATI